MTSSCGAVIGSCTPNAHHDVIQTRTNLLHWRCTNIRIKEPWSAQRSTSCIGNTLRIERNDFEWKPAKRIGLKGATHYDVKMMIHVTWSFNQRLLTSSEKHKGIFYEWNGLLLDIGRTRVMNDTWSKMETIHSHLVCRIWWFHLENIVISGN